MAGGLDLELWEKFRPERPTEDEIRCMDLLSLVDYEILSHKLQTIALEGKEVMIQTGSSLPLVAEDMNAGIYTANGDMAAAAAGVYFHTVTGQLPIKYAIKHWAPESSVQILEGDVFYSTDPLYGGTHTPDQICFMPIFYEGELVAWASAVAHQSDVGAIAPGVPAGAQSQFEDGMRIPPVKIGSDYELREDILNMFGQMTRVPDGIILDIRDRVATCMRIRERIVGFCEEHGRDALVGTLRKIIVNGAAEVRKKLSAYNDGTYRAVTFFDDVGVESGLTYLAAELTKKDDHVKVKVTASPQTPGAYNAFKPLSMASIANPLLNYLLSDVPASVGVMDVFDFDIEEGSILNALPGAAANSSLMVTFCLEQLFHICFAKMAFDSADRPHVAAPQDPNTLGSWFVGVDNFGRPYATLDTTVNGSGSGARCDKDGVDVFAPAWALYADLLDAETIESSAQLFFLYRRCSVDGHGFGKFRGGATPDAAVIVHDANKNAEIMGATLGFASKFTQPCGLFGGYGGACFPGVVIRNTNIGDLLRSRQDFPSSSRALVEAVHNGTLTGTFELTKAQRDMMVLRQGDIVVRAGGGGGGYGDVLERPAETVAQDVREGLLSVAAAERVYGVVINSDTGLRGRVAIVTGSGRGIGRGIALKLAECGAKVVVNGVTPAMVEETVKLIEKEGGEAHAVLANVSRSDDVRRLAAETLQRFGRIDILVNNAGVNRDAMFHKMTEEQWDEVIDVNLKGAWLCTREVSQNMRENRFGRVIMIGSEGGTYGEIGMANYSAAKAGMMGLTMTLAREFARWAKADGSDLTCNLIMPGYNVTRMTEGVPEHIKQRQLAEIPLGRVADSREDIGSVVAFLASPAASYVTGAKFSAGGGIHMNMAT